MLPNLPELQGHKTNKSVTKHYCNLFLYLDPSKLSLFTWLIYESHSDNTFTYSTHLLKRYSASIEAAREEYNPKGKITINTSPKSIRRDFKALVAGGFIWGVSSIFWLENKMGSQYMLNPLLAYRPEYIRKSEYKIIVDLYQRVRAGEGNIADLAIKYRSIVQKHLKAKNK